MKVKRMKKERQGEKRENKNQFRIQSDTGDGRRLLSKRPGCRTYFAVSHSANEGIVRSDGAIFQEILKTTPARFLY